MSHPNHAVPSLLLLSLTRSPGAVSFSRLISAQPPLRFSVTHYLIQELPIAMTDAMEDSPVGTMAQDMKMSALDSRTM
jgi:hypothetical protein